MNRFENNLDALLDCWRVPQLERDLTPTVVERARAEDAALDELLTRAAPKVSFEVDLADAVLARAHAEDMALDQALAVVGSVPPLASDLSRPVLRTIRRNRLRHRLVAIGGALATAAAVLLVVVLLRSHVQTPGTPQPAPLTVTEQKMLDDVGLQGYVEDLPVLVHWDTIRAMEQLDQEAPVVNSL